MTSLQAALAQLENSHPLQEIVQDNIRQNCQQIILFGKFSYVKKVINSLHVYSMCIIF